MDVNRRNLILGGGGAIGSEWHCLIADGREMKRSLMILCAFSLMACERSAEVPWYSVDIEFTDHATKMEMFDRLTRTIGDCGFRALDNPAVGKTIGRETVFRFFVTRDQQVAADLHDAHGQTVLSINLFLSGFRGEMHADECRRTIEAELETRGTISRLQQTTWTAALYPSPSATLILLLVQTQGASPSSMVVSVLKRDGPSA